MIFFFSAICDINEYVEVFVWPLRPRWDEKYMILAYQLTFWFVDVASDVNPAKGHGEGGGSLPSM
jgi:hypothetical protein